MAKTLHKCQACQQYKPDTWYSPKHGRWLCDECCEELAEKEKKG